MTSENLTYSIRKCMTALAAAITLLCTGACHSDRGCEPDSVEIGGSLPIYLTLNVACAEPLYPTTRADDYYFEDAQSKYEKIDHLRVIITNTAGTVVHNRLVGYYNDGSIKNDNLIFKVEAGDYDIHLFGNERSLPTAVRALLENAVENKSYPSTALNAVELTRGADSPFYGLEEYIPMTESFEVSLEMPLVEIDQYKTVDLFVTRIPVKFTFGIRENTESLTVRLRSMATRQYFLPHGVKYAPVKSETSEQRIITAYDVPANPGNEVFEFNFPTLEEKVLGNDDGKYFVTEPVYLCETGLPGSTGYEISIKICDAKDDLPEVWSEWKPLTNLPSLPRNTHAIVRMVNSASLNFQVDLMPYIGCTLDPWFGLEDKTTSEPETGD